MLYWFCPRCHEPLDDASTYCAAHADWDAVAIEIPHTHDCPDCTEAWTCEDVDCEPEESEKVCGHCCRLYL